ncbi:MAG TPA: hypothetical protein VMB82_04020, partial [Acidimicrobiales bacterium]|nr:hypothetical protein [Acidimicrobiales bacterium]
MIVLHGTWLGWAGRLALWAEDGDRPRRAPPRRGRPPRRPPPGPHPFAAGAGEVARAAAEVGGVAVEAAMATGEEGDLLLVLPSGP